MDKITLTEADIIAASDYMSSTDKEIWTENAAAKCIDKLGIKVGGEDMPPLYMVSSDRKARYLMTALCVFYLKKEAECESDDNDLMTMEEYDKWAGSHIVCQINRLKSNLAVKDKCFDLLSDYADLEKRLSTQISGLLMAQNDAVTRQAQYTKTMTEELPRILSELRSLQNARKGGGADGD